LANALAEKESDTHAYVRGKRVNYSKLVIDRVLRLRAVEKCDVEFRRSLTNEYKTRAEWDGLLEGIMRDGKGSIGTVARPQRINTVDLLPEYKAWASFILTLISDEDIDVGGLMYRSLKKLVRTDKTTLGHCCLINKLCQAAGVPVEPSDVYVRSLRPISDTVMAGFEKEQDNYDRKLRERGEQPRQPQMMEQDHIPQVPPPQVQQQGLPPYFAEYTYAMANWAQDISSRDRMPPPAFPQPFYDAAARYRQSASARANAYERFASPLDMENYFAEER